MGNATLPTSPDNPVMCPYCGKAAQHRLTSSALYTSGRDYGPVWICDPCKAWVGCHKNGQPLGRLANAELRRAKIDAHAAFDPLWQAKMRRDNVSKGKARGKGYAWLARQLGLPPQDAHIGMFDVAMCRRVIDVCSPYGAGHRALRHRYSSPTLRLAE